MDFIQIFNSLSRENIPFLQIIFILTLFLTINIKNMDNSLNKILSLKKVSIIFDKLILVSSAHILGMLFLFSFGISLIAVLFYGQFRTNLSWLKTSFSLMIFFSNIICIMPIWILLYCKFNSITAWSILKKIVTILKETRRKSILIPININLLTALMTFTAIGVNLSTLFDNRMALLILLISLIFFIFRAYLTSPHRDYK